jgi:hypothetical protein
MLKDPLWNEYDHAMHLVWLMYYAYSLDTDG